MPMLVILLAAGAASGYALNICGRDQNTSMVEPCSGYTLNLDLSKNPCPFCRGYEAGSYSECD